MTGVVISRKPPRLAKLISQPGGASAQDLLARAEEKLEEIREPLLLSIDDSLEQLEALASPFAVTHAPTMYRLASDLVGASLAERLDGVARAGRSLCDLLDEPQADLALTQSAISVHLASLRLLHRRTASEVDQQPILEGLDRLLARVRG